MGRDIPTTSASFQVWKRDIVENPSSATFSRVSSQIYSYYVELVAFQSGDVNNCISSIEDLFRFIVDTRQICGSYLVDALNREKRFIYVLLDDFFFNVVLLENSRLSISASLLSSLLLSSSLPQQEVLKDLWELISMLQRLVSLHMLGEITFVENMSLDCMSHVRHVLSGKSIESRSFASAGPVSIRSVQHAFLLLRLFSESVVEFLKFERTVLSSVDQSTLVLPIFNLKSLTDVISSFFVTISNMAPEQIGFIISRFGLLFQGDHVIETVKYSSLKILCDLDVSKPIEGCNSPLELLKLLLSLFEVFLKDCLFMVNCIISDRSFLSVERYQDLTIDYYGKCLIEVLRSVLLPRVSPGNIELVNSIFKFLHCWIDFEEDRRSELLKVVSLALFTDNSCLDSIRFIEMCGNSELSRISSFNEMLSQVYSSSITSYSLNQPSWLLYTSSVSCESWDLLLRCLSFGIRNRLEGTELYLPLLLLALSHPVHAISAIETLVNTFSCSVEQDEVGKSEEPIIGASVGFMYSLFSTSSCGPRDLMSAIFAATSSASPSTGRNRLIISGLQAAEAAFFHSLWKLSLGRDLLDSTELQECFFSLAHGTSANSGAQPPIWVHPDSLASVDVSLPLLRARLLIEPDAGNAEKGTFASSENRVFVEMRDTRPHSAVPTSSSTQQQQLPPLVLDLHADSLDLLALSRPSDATRALLQQQAALSVLLRLFLPSNARNILSSQLCNVISSKFSNSLINPTNTNALIATNVGGVDLATGMKPWASLLRASLLSAVREVVMIAQVSLSTALTAECMRISSSSTASRTASSSSTAKSSPVASFSTNSPSEADHRGLSVPEFVRCNMLAFLVNSVPPAKLPHIHNDFSTAIALKIGVPNRETEVSRNNGNSGSRKTDDLDVCRFESVAKLLFSFVSTSGSVSASASSQSDQGPFDVPPLLQTYAFSMLASVSLGLARIHSSSSSVPSNGSATKGLQSATQANNNSNNSNSVVPYHLYAEALARGIPYLSQLSLSDTPYTYFDVISFLVAASLPSSLFSYITSVLNSGDKDTSIRLDDFVFKMSAVYGSAATGGSVHASMPVLIGCIAVIMTTLRHHGRSFIPENKTSSLATKSMLSIFNIPFIPLCRSPEDALNALLLVPIRTSCDVTLAAASQSLRIQLQNPHLSRPASSPSNISLSSVVAGSVMLSPDSDFVSMVPVFRLGLKSTCKLIESVVGAVHGLFDFDPPISTPPSRSNLPTSTRSPWKHKDTHASLAASLSSSISAISTSLELAESIFHLYERAVVPQRLCLMNQSYMTSFLDSLMSVQSDGNTTATNTPSSIAVNIPSPPLLTLIGLGQLTSHRAPLRSSGYLTAEAKADPYADESPHPCLTQAIAAAVSQLLETEHAFGSSVVRHDRENLSISLSHSSMTKETAFPSFTTEDIFSSQKRPLSSVLGALCRSRTDIEGTGFDLDALRALVRAHVDSRHPAPLQLIWTPSDLQSASAAAPAISSKRKKNSSEPTTRVSPFQSNLQPQMGHTYVNEGTRLAPGTLSATLITSSSRSNEKIEYNWNGEFCSSVVSVNEATAAAKLDLSPLLAHKSALPTLGPTSVPSSNSSAPSNSNEVKQVSGEEWFSQFSAPEQLVPALIPSEVALLEPLLRQLVIRFVSTSFSPSKTAIVTLDMLYALRDFFTQAADTRTLLVPFTLFDIQTIDDLSIGNRGNDVELEAVSQTATPIFFVLRHILRAFCAPLLSQSTQSTPNASFGRQTASADKDSIPQEVLDATCSLIESVVFYCLKTEHLAIKVSPSTSEHSTIDTSQYKDEIYPTSHDLMRLLQIFASVELQQQLPSPLLRLSLQPQHWVPPEAPNYPLHSMVQTSSILLSNSSNNSGRFSVAAQLLVLFRCYVMSAIIGVLQGPVSRPSTGNANNLRKMHDLECSTLFFRQIMRLQSAAIRALSGAVTPPSVASAAAGTLFSTTSSSSSSSPPVGVGIVPGLGGVLGSAVGLSTASRMALGLVGSPLCPPPVHVDSSGSNPVETQGLGSNVVYFSDESSQLGKHAARNRSVHAIETVEPAGPGAVVHALLALLDLWALGVLVGKMASGPSGVSVSQSTPASTILGEVALLGRTLSAAAMGEVDRLCMILGHSPAATLRLFSAELIPRLMPLLLEQQPEQLLPHSFLANFSSNPQEWRQLGREVVLEKLFQSEQKERFLLPLFCESFAPAELAPEQFAVEVAHSLVPALCTIDGGRPDLLVVVAYFCRNHPPIRRKALMLLGSLGDSSKTSVSRRSVLVEEILKDGTFSNRPTENTTVATSTTTTTTTSTTTTSNTNNKGTQPKRQRLLHEYSLTTAPGILQTSTIGTGQTLGVATNGATIDLNASHHDPLEYQFNECSALHRAVLSTVLLQQYIPPVLSRCLLSPCPPSFGLRISALLAQLLPQLLRELMFMRFQQYLRPELLWETGAPLIDTGASNRGAWGLQALALLMLDTPKLVLPARMRSNTARGAMLGLLQTAVAAETAILDLPKNTNSTVADYSGISSSNSVGSPGSKLHSNQKTAVAEPSAHISPTHDVRRYYLRSDLRFHRFPSVHCWNESLPLDGLPVVRPSQPLSALRSPAGKGATGGSAAGTGAAGGQRIFRTSSPSQKLPDFPPISLEPGATKRISTAQALQAAGAVAAMDPSTRFEDSFSLTAVLAAGHLMASLPPSGGPLRMCCCGFALQQALESHPHRSYFSPSSESASTGSKSNSNFGGKKSDGLCVCGSVSPLALLVPQAQLQLLKSLNQLLREVAPPLEHLLLRNFLDSISRLRESVESVLTRSSTSSIPFAITKNARLEVPLRALAALQRAAVRMASLEPLGSHINPILGFLRLCRQPFSTGHGTGAASALLHTSNTSNPAFTVSSSDHNVISFAAACVWSNLPLILSLSALKQHMGEIFAGLLVPPPARLITGLGGAGSSGSLSFSSGASFMKQDDEDALLGFENDPFSALSRASTIVMGHSGRKSITDKANGEVSSVLPLFDSSASRNSNVGTLQIVLAQQTVGGFFTHQDELKDRVNTPIVGIDSHYLRFAGKEYDEALRMRLQPLSTISTQNWQSLFDLVDKRAISRLPDGCTPGLSFPLHRIFDYSNFKIPSDNTFLVTTSWRLSPPPGGFSTPVNILGVPVFTIPPLPGLRGVSVPRARAQPSSIEAMASRQTGASSLSLSLMRTEADLALRLWRILSFDKVRELESTAGPATSATSHSSNSALSADGRELRDYKEALAALPLLVPSSARGLLPSYRFGPIFRQQLQLNRLDFSNNSNTSSNINNNNNSNNLNGGVGEKGSDASMRLPAIISTLCGAAAEPKILVLRELLALLLAASNSTSTSTAPDLQVLLPLSFSSESALRDPAIGPRVLAQLIQLLLELVAESSSPITKALASKCLGVLGAVNPDSLGRLGSYAITEGLAGPAALHLGDVELVFSLICVLSRSSGNSNREAFVLRRLLMLYLHLGGVPAATQTHAATTQGGQSTQSGQANASKSKRGRETSLLALTTQTTSSTPTALTEAMDEEEGGASNSSSQSKALLTLLARDCRRLGQDWGEKLISRGTADSQNGVSKGGNVGGSIGEEDDDEDATALLLVVEPYLENFIKQDEESMRRRKDTPLPVGAIYSLEAAKFYGSSTPSSGAADASNPHSAVASVAMNNSKVGEFHSRWLTRFLQSLCESLGKRGDVCPRAVLWDPLALATGIIESYGASILPFLARDAAMVAIVDFVNNSSRNTPANNRSKDVQTAKTSVSKEDKSKKPQSSSTSTEVNLDSQIDPKLFVTNPYEGLPPTHPASIVIREFTEVLSKAPPRDDAAFQLWSQCAQTLLRLRDSLRVWALKPSTFGPVSLLSSVSNGNSSSSSTPGSANKASAGVNVSVSSGFLPIAPIYTLASALTAGPVPVQDMHPLILYSLTTMLEQLPEGLASSSAYLLDQLPSSLLQVELILRVRSGIMANGTVAFPYQSFLGIRPEQLPGLAPPTPILGALDPDSLRISSDVLGGVIYSKVPHSRAGLLDLQALLSRLGDPDSAAGISAVRARLRQESQSSLSENTTESSAATSSNSNELVVQNLFSGKEALQQNPIDSSSNLQLWEAVFDADSQPQWEESLHVFEAVLSTMQDQPDDTSFNKFDTFSQNNSSHPKGTELAPRGVREESKESGERKIMPLVTFFNETSLHSRILEKLKNAGNRVTLMHATGLLSSLRGRLALPGLAEMVYPQAIAAAIGSNSFSVLGELVEAVLPASSPFSGPFTRSDTQSANHAGAKSSLEEETELLRSLRRLPTQTVVTLASSFEVFLGAAVLALCRAVAVHASRIRLASGSISLPQLDSNVGNSVSTSSFINSINGINGNLDEILRRGQLSLVLRGAGGVPGQAVSSETLLSKCGADDPYCLISASPAPSPLGYAAAQSLAVAPLAALRTVVTEQSPALTLSLGRSSLAKRNRSATVFSSLPRSGRDKALLNARSELTEIKTSQPKSDYISPIHLILFELSQFRYFVRRARDIVQLSLVSMGRGGGISSPYASSYPQVLRLQLLRELEDLAPLALMPVADRVQSGLLNPDRLNERVAPVGLSLHSLSPLLSLFVMVSRHALLPNPPSLYYPSHQLYDANGEGAAVPESASATQAEIYPRGNSISSFLQRSSAETTAGNNIRNSDSSSSTDLGDDARQLCVAVETTALEALGTAATASEVPSVAAASLAAAGLMGSENAEVSRALSLAAKNDIGRAIRVLEPDGSSLVAQSGEILESVRMATMVYTEAAARTLPSGAKSKANLSSAGVSSQVEESQSQTFGLNNTITNNVAGRKRAATSAVNPKNSPLISDSVTSEVLESRYEELRSAEEKLLRARSRAFAHANRIVMVASWKSESRLEAPESISEAFKTATKLRPRWDTLHQRWAQCLDQEYTSTVEQSPSSYELRFKQFGLTVQTYLYALRYGTEHIMVCLPRALTLLFEHSYLLYSLKESNEVDLQIDPRTLVACEKIVRTMWDILLRLITAGLRFYPCLPHILSHISHPYPECREAVQKMALKSLHAAPKQSVWHLWGFSEFQEFQSIISRFRGAEGSSSAVVVAGLEAFTKGLHDVMASKTKAAASSAKGKPFNLPVGRLIPIEAYENQQVLVPLQASLTASLTRINSAAPPVVTHPGSGVMGRREDSLSSYSSLSTTKDEGPVPPDSYYFVLALPAAAPCLAGIQNEAMVMSSLVRPVRLGLMGTDGRLYRLLVKQEERGSMRKDAVVMEVASELNRLFTGDPAAFRRSLRLMTYAVTPISIKAGLVEWINNSIVFSEAFQESKNIILMKLAMRSLDPNGIVSKTSSTASTDFNSLVQSLQRQTSEFSSKLSIQFGQLISRLSQSIRETGHESERTREAQKNARQFFIQKLMPHYPPTFHAWFLRHFYSPVEWVRARATFARSAAVWSIVGYTLGIGDRHLHNVLIHNTSAEVMHVDFDVLFEKGKTLPAPEVVPFRLTPNMLDALGISGFEGAFRALCETCLITLRKNRVGMVSAIEPMVYNPLISWDDLKRKDDASQNGAASSGANGTGEKSGKIKYSHGKNSINIVGQKLSGRYHPAHRPVNSQEKETRVLGVSGYVQSLLKDATSLDNLGVMFNGWAAQS